MTLRRRDFLAGIALSSVAGCLRLSSESENESTVTSKLTNTATQQTPQPEPEPDQTPEPTPEPTPEQTETTQTIADETIDLPEGQYSHYPFTLNGQSTVEYSFAVRNGPAMDVFVATSTQFNRYQSEEPFATVISSQELADDRQQDVLQSGDYVLVVDNTKAGWAKPRSNVNYDVAIIDIAAAYQ